MFVINNGWAAIFSFVTGILTIIACFVSVRTVYSNQYLHNSFGVICATQSICIAAVAAFGAFWAAPITAFLPTLSTHFIAYVVGLLFNIAFYISLWCHLCKSINRGYAIFSPLQYRQNFTIKNTIKLIIAVAAMALLYSSIFVWYPCNYYFDVEWLMWRTRTQQCLDTYFYYLDIGIISTTVLGSVALDFITLCYLIAFKKRVQYNITTAAATIVSFNEIKFFTQTLITAMICSLSCAVTYIETSHFPSVTAVFFLKTMNWQLMDFLNQLIFIAFTMKIPKKPMKLKIFVSISKIGPWKNGN